MLYPNYGCQEEDYYKQITSIINKYDVPQNYLMKMTYTNNNFMKKTWWKKQKKWLIISFKSTWGKNGPPDFVFFILKLNLPIINIISWWPYKEDTPNKNYRKVKQPKGSGVRYFYQFLIGNGDLSFCNIKVCLIFVSYSTPTSFHYPALLDLYSVLTWFWLESILIAAQYNIKTF